MTVNRALIQFFLSAIFPLMAKLIPTLNSCLSTMTGGKKRMAQSLEDDYTVWYDVPIRSKQFRPDFIILHPQRGILVLEVKDWKLTTSKQLTTNHSSC